MDTLLLPIGLILLGLVLLACEAFIPSAGLLGILSGSAILAGIGMAFYSGGLAIGTAFLGGTVLAVTSTIAALIRWWPETPLGKLILIDPRPADEFVPDLSPLQQLVGQVGQTRVLMLPSGIIDIEGRTYDAITEGPSVEKGIWVEVTSVRGRNLVVRPISEEIAHQLRSTQALSSDPLSGPVDDVVPDPFADPLA